MVYSTENVNYAQRKACFQYNLVIETLSNEAKFGDMVGQKLKFYAYDAYQQGFPKGIPTERAPPHDINGRKVASEEQRRSGLPAIYIFPAKQKSLPFTRMLKFPYAEDLIDFIVEKSASGIKLNAADFKGLGKRTVDE